MFSFASDASFLLEKRPSSIPVDYLIYTDFSVYSKYLENFSNNAPPKLWSRLESIYELGYVWCLLVLAVFYFLSGGAESNKSVWSSPSVWQISSSSSFIEGIIDRFDLVFLWKDLEITACFCLIVLALLKFYWIWLNPSEAIFINLCQ